MRRREVIAGLGSLPLLPVRRAQAQQDGRVHRVAVLSPSEFSADHIRAVVLPDLARLGFVAGRNLVMTFHVGPLSDLSRLALDALSTDPDAIIASSNSAVAAVLEHSATVPIVMAFAGEDPVAAGLAKTLARPGGSVTGLTNLATQLDGKRVTLLVEAAPGTRRIGIVAVPPPRHLASIAEISRVAESFGVKVTTAYAHRPEQYAAAFASLRSEGADAVQIASAPEYLRDAATIAAQAREAGLPTVCEASDMVRNGCLISYGTRFDEFRRRAADFVARILRGAAPADMPIEQPTIFELVINLRTAQTIRLAIPPSLLARADEVIE
jgi:putative tryptophan/tyrosine transport system substrate-binding protein